MPQHAEKNARLDRIAAIQRIAAVVLLLPYIFWLLLSGRWVSPLHWLVIGGVTVGGAVLYHVLTSVRHCVHCGASITAFAIRKPGPLGKRFSCASCGQHTDSREGFVWLDGA
jgi:hypothetical protein